MLSGFDARFKAFASAFSANIRSILTQNGHFENDLHNKMQLEAYKPSHLLNTNYNFFFCLFKYKIVQLVEQSVEEDV